MTRLFRDESSDAKTNAQRNLSGRTHYVDDETLRYHHSRVISARTFANGQLFAIVTSDAKDYENKSRGFRYVIFDLFGTVIERNPRTVDNEWFRTSDKARAARDAFLATFDAAGHTVKAIGKARRDFEIDIQRLVDEVAQANSKAA
jgi:hypothetical protein